MQSRFEDHTIEESILDTDVEITKRTQEETDKIKYINNYVNLVKKEFGKYIIKKESHGGLFYFHFDDKGYDKIERHRDKKIQGFDVKNDGPTNFYVILKNEDLWFEWNYFKNYSVDGNDRWILKDRWILDVGPVDMDQSNLQEYAKNTLEEKLLK